MPINNRELSQFGSFVEVADSTKFGIAANVGIGSTLPTVKLEVHGDVKTVTGKVGVQTAASVDLQVYGQTQLDDLNVLGVGTFGNGIECSGAIMNVTAGFVANSARISDLTDNRVVISGGSGELEDDDRFTFDGSDLTVGLGVSGVTISKDGNVSLASTINDALAGPILDFYRNSESPANADYLGQIKFQGENDADEKIVYAKITGKIQDVANGSEDGIIEFANKKAGGNVITARLRSDSLQLVNGTSLTVAGDADVTGDLDVDGNTDLDSVRVSLAATFSDLVDIDGGLEANSAKIGDLTANRVVYTSAGGELETDNYFTFDGKTVGISTFLSVSGVATFTQGINIGDPNEGHVAITTNSITGPAEMFIDPAAVGDNTGVVRIKGDLYVDGTTTQINSETLTIADFVVGIASTATTDALADGAGINIGPDNTFKYEHNGGTTPSLKSSENLNVASGKGYQIAEVEVLNATTLGSNVVSSSLTSVGTLGGLTVSGDVSIADKIIHSGDTNTFLSFPEADAFTVTTDGTERVRIRSNGNVGIGTTNAQYEFHVKGGGTVAYFEGSGGNGFIGIEDADDDTVAFIGVDGGTLKFQTSGDTYSDKLVILPDGSVGIATANPSAYGNFADNFVIYDPSKSGMTFATSITGYGSIYFADGTVGNQVSRGQIQYGHADDYMAFATAAVESLRIDSDNKLLVGVSTARSNFYNTSTINPRLQIEGTNYSDSALSITTNGATNNRNPYSILLLSRSRGTALESNTVVVKNDILGAVDFQGSDGSQFVSAAAIEGVVDDDPGANDMPGALSFLTTANSASTPTEKLRITSAGLVGIGTVIPTKKLEVAGGAVSLSPDTANKHTHEFTTNAANDGRYFIRSNTTTKVDIQANGDSFFNGGQVGIGTATPRGTSKLDVEGLTKSRGLQATANETPTAGYGVEIFAPSSSQGMIQAFNRTGSSQMELKLRGSDITFFGSSNSDERMRMTGVGSFGIGTATPEVNLVVSGTNAIRIPSGTTLQRPTGQQGQLRYNSDIASFEGHNGTEWAGIGGAAEKETSVSSTSATSCETFAKGSYRSASIVAQITQGSSYQVGNYLVIHDGTTATLIEESAVATGEMLGTFSSLIIGSNVVIFVTMNSSSAATVTTKMTKVSIP